MLSIELPIYYTQTFKTKKDKVHLVGMNAYRNWHYHLKNDVKVFYHELVKEQLSDPIPETLSQFTVKYTLYYKNSGSDPSNVIALMEKFALDAFKEAGLIIDDNAKYHLGSSWEVAGQDRVNPRVIVELTPKD